MGQRKAPTSPSSGRLNIPLVGILLALSCLGWLVGCAFEEPREGVISTENAGRVRGKLVRSDSVEVDFSAEARLVRVGGDGSQSLAGRVSVGVGGSYSFAEVKPGNYRIDASLPNGLRGSSGVFTVEAGKPPVELLVVLVVVPSFQFVLLPSQGDSIVAVWAGDEGRLSVRNGSAWIIPVVPGVPDAVGVVVHRASGATETVSYRLIWVGNAANLQAVGSTAAAPLVDSASMVAPRHFGIDANTVSLWGFDSPTGGAVKDLSGHGRNLVAQSGWVPEASPFGNAVATGSVSFQTPLDSAFTPAVSGQILYEARVFLGRYPSSSLHNGRAAVMGFYEGPKLLVTDSGSLQIAGQRGEGEFWNWAGGESRRNTVPLGRWVDLAIACEYATGRVWAWVDSVPLPLYAATAATGHWRTAFNPFVVGMDLMDGQAFVGKIDEIRISKAIPASWSRLELIQ